MSAGEGFYRTWTVVPGAAAYDEAEDDEQLLGAGDLLLKLDEMRGDGSITNPWGLRSWFMSDAEKSQVIKSIVKILREQWGSSVAAAGDDEEVGAAAAPVADDDEGAGAGAAADAADDESAKRFLIEAIKPRDWKSRSLPLAPLDFLKLAAIVSKTDSSIKIIQSDPGLLDRILREMGDIFISLPVFLREENKFRDRICAIERDLAISEVQVACYFAIIRKVFNVKKRVVEEAVAKIIALLGESSEAQGIKSSFDAASSDIEDIITSFGLVVKSYIKKDDPDYSDDAAFQRETLMFKRRFEAANSKADSAAMAIAYNLFAVARKKGKSGASAREIAVKLKDSVIAANGVIKHEKRLDFSDYGKFQWLMIIAYEVVKLRREKKEKAEYMSENRRTGKELVTSMCCLLENFYIRRQYETFNSHTFGNATDAIISMQRFGMTIEDSQKILPYLVLRIDDDDSSDSKRFEKDPYQEKKGIYRMILRAYLKDAISECERQRFEIGSYLSIKDIIRRQFTSRDREWFLQVMDIEDADAKEIEQLVWERGNPFAIDTTPAIGVAAADAQEDESDGSDGDSGGSSGGAGDEAARAAADLEDESDGDGGGGGGADDDAADAPAVSFAAGAAEVVGDSVGTGSRLVRTWTVVPGAAAYDEDVADEKLLGAGDLLLKLDEMRGDGSITNPWGLRSWFMSDAEKSRVIKSIVKVLREQWGNSVGDDAAGDEEEGEVVADDEEIGVGAAADAADEKSAESLLKAVIEPRGWMSRSLPLAPLDLLKLAVIISETDEGIEIIQSNWELSQRIAKEMENIFPSLPLFREEEKGFRERICAIERDLAYLKVRVPCYAAEIREAFNVKKRVVEEAVAEIISLSGESSEVYREVKETKARFDAAIREIEEITKRFNPLLERYIEQDDSDFATVAFVRKTLKLKRSFEAANKRADSAAMAIADSLFAIAREEGESGADAREIAVNLKDSVIAANRVIEPKKWMYGGFQELMILADKVAKLRRKKKEQAKHMSENRRTGKELVTSMCLLLKNKSIEGIYRGRLDEREKFGIVIHDVVTVRNVIISMRKLGMTIDDGKELIPYLYLRQSDPQRLSEIKIKTYKSVLRSYLDDAKWRLEIENADIFGTWEPEDDGGFIIDFLEREFRVGDREWYCQVVGIEPKKVESLEREIWGKHNPFAIDRTLKVAHATPAAGAVVEPEPRVLEMVTIDTAGSDDEGGGGGGGGSADAEPVVATEVAAAVVATRRGAGMVSVAAGAVDDGSLDTAEVLVTDRHVTFAPDVR